MITGARISVRGRTCSTRECPLLLDFLSPPPRRVSSPALPHRVCGKQTGIRTQVLAQIAHRRAVARTQVLAKTAHRKAVQGRKSQPKQPHAKWYQDARPIQTAPAASGKALAASEKKQSLFGLCLLCVLVIFRRAFEQNSTRRGTYPQYPFRLSSQARALPLRGRSRLLRRRRGGGRQLCSRGLHR